MPEAQAEIEVQLKRVQKERAVAEEELAHWRRRVKPAGNRGEPILKKSTEGRVAELQATVARLLAQERALGARGAHGGN